jgi:hypothetical protein
VKRLVAAGAVGIALIALALATVIRFPGGPLDEGGGWATSAPLHAGKPITAGLYSLRNKSDRAIQVEKVSLANHTEGLHFLSALALKRGPSAALTTGFPPAMVENRSDLQAAEGLVLRGHETVPLVIGLRADAPGSYRLEGVVVEYRMRVAGKLGPRFRRVMGGLTTMCLQGAPPERPHCKPPSISS